MHANCTGGKSCWVLDFVTARERSDKRSKFNSKCDPTFFSSCVCVRSAGGYFDWLTMCSCSVDFWYHLHEIRDNLNNPEFGIRYDLITRFMVLPHTTASAERVFSLVSHVKTRTNSLKLRLSSKVVGKTSIVKKPSKRLYVDT